MFEPNVITPDNSRNARKSNDGPPIRLATEAEVREQEDKGRSVGNTHRNPDVKEVNKPQEKDQDLDAVSRRYGLYMEDKWMSRRYYSDYQQTTEIMRATEGAIKTTRSDETTIAAMLHLAQERGWQSIKARGDESFKREVWVSAQALGIEVTGYKPTQTDQQELEKRKKEITPAEIPKAEAKQQASQPTQTPEPEAAAKKSAPVPVKIAPKPPEQKTTVQTPTPQKKAQAPKPPQEDTGKLWQDAVVAGEKAAGALQMAKQQKQPAQMTQ